MKNELIGATIGATTWTFFALAVSIMMAINIKAEAHYHRGVYWVSWWAVVLWLWTIDVGFWYWVRELSR